MSRDGAWRHAQNCTEPQPVPACVKFTFPGKVYANAWRKTFVETGGVSFSYRDDKGVLHVSWYAHSIFGLRRCDRLFGKGKPYPQIPQAIDYSAERNNVAMTFNDGIWKAWMPSFVISA